MLSRSRKAFTLIELIVVIVILGLLAALAIPTFQEVINKTRVQTAITSAESVGRNAVALAAFDEGTATLGGLREAAKETNGKVVVATAGAEDVTANGAELTINGKTIVVTVDGNSVSAAEKAAPVVP